MTDATPDSEDLLEEFFVPMEELLCTHCGLPKSKATHYRLKGYQCQCGNNAWVPRPKND